MSTDRYVVFPEYPSHARSVVRSALIDAPVEVIEVAELLTSELVTNAMVHASGTPTVIVETAKDHIRVEVQDEDVRGEITSLQVPPSSEHGRGLAIVEALSTSWGVEMRTGGKGVWFFLSF